MSTISNTAQGGLVSRLRLTRRLVVLALIAALAAATLTVTIVLVASGGSGSPAPQHAVPAAQQRLYMGGPGEGAPGMRTPSRSAEPSAPANDGSQHPGRRP
jgi:hypothetical protein